MNKPIPLSLNCIRNPGEELNYPDWASIQEIGKGGANTTVQDEEFVSALLMRFVSLCQLQRTAGVGMIQAQGIL